MQAQRLWVQKKHFHIEVSIHCSNINNSSGESRTLWMTAVLHVGRTAFMGSVRELIFSTTGCLRTHGNTMERTHSGPYTLCTISPCLLPRYIHPHTHTLHATPLKHTLEGCKWRKWDKRGVITGKVAGVKSLTPAGFVTIAVRTHVLSLDCRHRQMCCTCGW